MKITIEATEKLTYVNGVNVRVWEGRTESGIRCLVLVHRIAVPAEENQEQFQRELQERMPPLVEVEWRHIV